MPARFPDLIRQSALELGFDRVGFARVDPERERREHGRFMAWLAAGHAAGLDYLARGAARRESVTRIVPGARSVVTVASSYGHASPPPAPGEPRISLYARGRDYHRVLERKLRQLTLAMHELDAEAAHRWYVDTGPVLERSWAGASGLAWIGKNTLAIHPELGSYFFIGVVITTLDLEPMEPIADHCGTCTRCLDACPTQALVAPFELDARRCIAYWNVEHRGDLPPAVEPMLGDWVFGCDVCQEVCPWNRPDRAAAPADDSLAPAVELSWREPGAWVGQLSHTAMRRARRQGLLRNLATVLANQGRSGASAQLAELERDDDPVVARAARRALARLGVETPS